MNRIDSLIAQNVLNVDSLINMRRAVTLKAQELAALKKETLTGEEKARLERYASALDVLIDESMQVIRVAQEETLKRIEEAKNPPPPPEPKLASNVAPPNPKKAKGGK